MEGRPTETLQNTLHGNSNNSVTPAEGPDTGTAMFRVTQHPQLRALRACKGLQTSQVALCYIPSEMDKYT